MENYRKLSFNYHQIPFLSVSLDVMCLQISTNVNYMLRVETMGHVTMGRGRIPVNVVQVGLGGTVK